MKRNKSMKIKKARALHQRIIFSVATFSIIIMCSFICSGFMTSAHDTQRIIPTRISYKSIQIETGDSLWSIAEKYKPENISMNDYIHELIHLNALKSNVIHADQFLTVSCYEYKLM